MPHFVFTCPATSMGALDAIVRIFGDHLIVGRLRTVNGRRRSLRDVAAELKAAGHDTADGTRYAATAVARMIAA